MDKKYFVLILACSVIYFVFYVFFVFPPAPKYQAVATTPTPIAVVPTSTPNSTVAPSSLRLDINFKLPTGWSATKSDDSYLFTSGLYTIKFGESSSNSKNCLVNKDTLSQFTFIKNPIYGSHTYRPNPINPSASTLVLCADLVKPDSYTSQTKIGSVTYELPDSWTNKKLDQMDQIIESIKLK